jgi:hypothetical protein
MMMAPDRAGTGEDRIRENLQSMLKDNSEGEDRDDVGRGGGDRRRGDGTGAAPLSSKQNRNGRGGDGNGDGAASGLVPRPSVVPRMSIVGGMNGGGGHRRRSSIFLRRTSLGGSSVTTLGMVGVPGGGVGSSAPSQENLMALYKKTLRMNAENRINSANSWNLNLIDHIDKFVHDDDDNDGGEGEGVGDRRDRGTSRARRSPEEAEDDGDGDEGRRVNFTKASCTLDASIKVCLRPQP